MVVAERRSSCNVSPQKHRTVDTKTNNCLLSFFHSCFAVKLMGWWCPMGAPCLHTFQGHIHAPHIHRRNNSLKEKHTDKYYNPYPWHPSDTHRHFVEFTEDESKFYCRVSQHHNTYSVNYAALLVAMLNTKMAKKIHLMLFACCHGTREGGQAVRDLGNLQPEFFYMWVLYIILSTI